MKSIQQTNHTVKTSLVRMRTFITLFVLSIFSSLSAHSQTEGNSVQELLFGRYPHMAMKVMDYDVKKFKNYLGTSKHAFCTGGEILVSVEANLVSVSLYLGSTDTFEETWEDTDKERVARYEFSYNQSKVSRTYDEEGSLASIRIDTDDKSNSVVFNRTGSEIIFLQKGNNEGDALSVYCYDNSNDFLLITGGGIDMTFYNKYSSAFDKLDAWLKKYNK